MTSVSNGGTTTLGLYDAQSQLAKKADITYVDNKVDPLIGGHKGYATLAQAQAAQSGLAANTVVEVLSDTTEANNGYYLWNGITLTKTTFSPLVQANNYTDSKVATAKAEAIAAAATDATTKANAAISTASSDATTKSNNAVITANSYTDSRYNSLVVETEQFANQAEAAATAANIAGKVYATPSEGVAPTTGVPSGQYFNVRSSLNDNYIDEYLNNAGVAQATGKSYPSSAYVQDIENYVAKPFVTGKTYVLNKRVQLSNGDIVRSTVAANTVNPNVDMTGWVKVNAASQIFDESGKTQQEINNNITAVHYVEDWGDSNEDIQAAINELSDIGYSSGQAQELVFCANKTYRAHMIKLRPFVDLNLNGCTIKKTDYTGTDENVPKWWRVILPDYPAFHDRRSKSHRIVIKNGKLDGNYLGTNWTWGTYNQEQASLIYLSTASSNMSDKDDRCKFLVENVTFSENCSDGLHVGINADVIMRNLEAFDCFRGGLVITGGNSIIAGSGFDGVSARLDTEIDGVGFDGIWETDIILDNIYVDRNGRRGNFNGGGDLGTPHGGNCILTNIHLMTPPITFRTSEKTNLKIKTATLALSADTAAANNSYMRNCNDELEDITFILTEDNSFFRIIPTSAVTTDVLEKTVATLKKIKFRKINADIIAPQSCIKLESQRTESLNYLDFDDLDTSEIASTYAIELAAGGKVKVNNLKHNSLQAIRATFLTTSKVDLTIGSVTNGQRTTALLSTTVSNTSGVDNELHFTKDCILKSNELQIIGTGNAKFPIFTTQRTIFGDVPPTANLHVFQGDVYKLNNPVLGKPSEWMCTTTGKTGNVWRATKWLVGSFGTSALPVLTSFDIGVENFDITLNKFVKWSGTAWV